MAPRHPKRNIVDWYAHMGVDEAVGEQAINRFEESLEMPSRSSSDQEIAQLILPADKLPHINPRGALIAQATKPISQKKNPAPGQASSEKVDPFLKGRNHKTAEGLPAGVSLARSLANQAKTLEELREALDAFEECALKTGAKTTVFGDGDPKAAVMLVGEAPGAEEDAQGKPFVGVSGKLLSRMLETIGLSRSQVFISNVVPYRPPGNRQPTGAEVALCLPFIERQIELIAPRFLIMVGGTAAKALLGRTDGVMRLRGQWLDYKTCGLAEPVKAITMFHPAYLLRSPLQKKEAWKDLLALKIALDTLPA